MKFIIFSAIFVSLFCSFNVRSQTTKKENIFVAPDGSFQIELPAYTSEAVQQLNSQELELDGTGTRYIWDSEKIRISIKSVYSEHFPYSNEQNGKKKFWLETIGEVKGYETQEGSKIVEEKDLSSDDYFGTELKEITQRGNIAFSRYYFTGTKFFTVLIITTDKNIENEARKYIESFKLLK